MTGTSPSTGSTRHLVLAVMAVVVTTAAPSGFRKHPLSPAGLWTGERASLGCKTFYPLVYGRRRHPILASFALLVSFRLTDNADPSGISMIRGWSKGSKPADAPY